MFRLRRVLSACHEDTRLDHTLIKIDGHRFPKSEINCHRFSIDGNRWCSHVPINQSKGSILEINGNQRLNSFLS